MPLLLHAAHIQTHTHIVSGFFVNPKYFQSHSFGAFSFHSKIWTKWWKKNGIDNKEIDAQLLHKNKRVCFRAEHSEMHRTWMIPIEQQKENEKKIVLVASVSQLVSFGWCAIWFVNQTSTHSTTKNINIYMSMAVDSTFWTGHLIFTQISSAFKRFIFFTWKSRKSI